MTASEQPFRAAEDREAVAAAFRGSAEMEEMTSAMDAYDQNTLTTFGAAAAREMAQACDETARSLSRLQSLGDTDLLERLGALMKQFDLGELKDSRLRLDALMGREDRVLEKYRRLGAELGEVYARLLAVEAELNRQNAQMKRLFDAGLARWRELVKHTEAAEQACRELEAHIAARLAEQSASGDDERRMDLHTLSQSLNLLKNRARDLRTAELAALQTLPLLEMMWRSNEALAQKLRAAVLVSLPVLRQALAEAVEDKKRRLQAKALRQVEIGAAKKAPVEALSASLKTLRQDVALTRAAAEENRRSLEKWRGR